MPFLIDPVGAVIAILVLGFFLWSNIRFLYQGYWYRQQSDDDKQKLSENHRDWFEYHGRDLPIFQLMLMTVIASVAVVWYLWKHFPGLFK